MYKGKFRKKLLVIAMAVCMAFGSVPAFAAESGEIISETVYGESVSFPGGGLSLINGVWCYYSNGVINTNYSMLAQSPVNKQWYYVKNGKLDWNYTGLGQSPVNGQWYYVSKGKLDWSYTGLGQSPVNGLWYYVKNGKLDWSYTGVAYLYGIPLNVKNGKVVSEHVHTYMYMSSIWKDGCTETTYDTYECVCGDKIETATSSVYHEWTLSHAIDDLNHPGYVLNTYKCHDCGENMTVSEKL